MAQDNEVKRPAFMPVPENLAGKESGATNLIPNASYSKQDSMGLNQSASAENLSAKYKYPRVSEDVPAAGQNQYQ